MSGASLMGMVFCLLQEDVFGMLVSLQVCSIACKSKEGMTRIFSSKTTVGRESDCGAPIVEFGR